ncbi:MAG: hypothetical protein AABZ47_06945 [Planctomycetota bacterium]
MNPQKNQRSLGAAELATLLVDLSRALEPLAENLQRRIDAARAVDMEQMQSLHDESTGLVKRLRERDGLRRQIMDRMVAELGASGRPGRMWSLTELVSRLSPKDAAKLSASAAILRGVMDRVVKLSRQVGSISDAIVRHLTWVFSAVRLQPEFGSYSVGGVAVGASDSRIVDTLG